MTDKPTRTAATDPRKARLAEALRANLAKRKAQARSRRAPAARPEPAAKAPPAGDGGQD